MQPQPITSTTTNFLMAATVDTRRTRP